MKKKSPQNTKYFQKLLEFILLLSCPLLQIVRECSYNYTHQLQQQQTMFYFQLPVSFLLLFSFSALTQNTLTKYVPNNSNHTLVRWMNYDINFLVLYAFYKCMIGQKNCIIQLLNDISTLKVHIQSRFAISKPRNIKPCITKYLIVMRCKESNRA